jgi:hypothetical protein
MISHFDKFDLSVNLPESVNELICFGDTSGNFEATKQMLEYIKTKIITTLHPNRLIIDGGDRLVDRGAGGINIYELFTENNEISQNPKIISLLGNHDEIFIRFFTYPPESIINHLNYIQTNKPAVLDDLKGFIEPFNKFLKKDYKSIHDFLNEKNPAKILTSMQKEFQKEDSEAHKLFQKIAYSPLGIQVDNDLIIHTDPTPKILESLEKHEGISGVNKELKRLTDVLLFDSQAKNIKEIRTMFLRFIKYTWLSSQNRRANYKNRKLLGNQVFGLFKPEQVKILTALAVKHIIHFHSPLDNILETANPNPYENLNNIKISCFDSGYGHPKNANLMDQLIPKAVFQKKYTTPPNIIY